MMKRGLYFLSQLDDLDVDWLLSAGRSEEVSAGLRLIEKGQVRSDLILILDGQVRVFDSDTDQKLAELDRGELIGEVSFVDRRGATACAETTKPSRIFRLPCDRLDEKLSRDPIFCGRFYAMIAAFLSGRLRDVLAPNEASRQGGDPGDVKATTSLALARLGRLLHRLAPDDEVTIAGHDMTIEDVVKVARHRNQAALGKSARDRLEASRRVVDKLASSECRIYGINTGLGALRDTTVSPDDFEAFQRNILLSHAAGVPPNYPNEVVRAIMLARLNGMARGGAGVSPDVFDQLLALLNANVVPIIPGRGSVGMSDLAPLAHMSLPLIGEGEVFYEGREMPAYEALRKAGLAPVCLGAKDGLALVSANSAAIGHGALVIARCIELLAHADIAAAMSIEAFGANPSPLDERLLPERPHQGQVMTTTRLRALLRRQPEARKRRARNLQDPISFRCVPQVHGPCQEALATARRVVELELNSTGDNPVVLAETGDIISNGNFHPAGLALAFEALALAVAQVCSAATNRTLRLNDAAMTGLPNQLIAKPGLNSGFGVLQKTVTMLNAQARFLASPASLDFMPVAGSIEDHSTMSTFVVAKCEDQLETAERILAIEMLTAAQAIDLRGEIELGVGARAAYDTVRRRVDVMIEDRLIAADVEAVYGLLHERVLMSAVGQAAQIEFGGFQ